MPLSGSVPDHVQTRLDDFLSSRASILAGMSGDADRLVAFSRDFLSGGKRFRARFCVAGWRAIAGSAADDGPGLSAALSVAAAIEMFQAAALVHDDIIDNSDTRRGAPSAHRRFEAEHGAAGWDGEAGSYGLAAAILLGDLFLGWSDELLDEGLALVPPSAALAARAEFVRMRTEVTAGQFLDVLEEQAWRSHDDAEQLRRAETVIVYKSAKYSVESPLALGALLADADAPRLAALRRYGLPVGIAFQLRDDLLGVFGDPSVTGKPSGDDLREGKRTVLIGMTRGALGRPDADRLDALLGDERMSDADVAWIQDRIVETGAAERVERRIADAVAEADAALDGAGLDPAVVEELRSLADTVTRRSA